MNRTGTTKLQSPWLTASLTRPRTKIVVDDEGKAIAICKGMKAIEAVQVVEKLIKKEFDVVWNSQPKVFEGIAHEETGESGLRIQKR
jgi:hypothetical protein